MPRPGPRMFSSSTPIYGNASKSVSTSANTRELVINRHKLVRSWNLFSPEIAQEKHWAMDGTESRVIQRASMETAGKYTK